MNHVNNDNAFAMILDRVHEDSVEATAKPTQIIGDWDMGANEGKLAVDVAQDETNLYIISAIAGAAIDRIEVYAHNDLVTIRGLRENPLDKHKEIEYFYSECFWGIFSRTIVLPTDVKGELARARYQGGILTVTIPKRHGDTHVPIEVVDE